MCGACGVAFRVQNRAAQLGMGTTNADFEATFARAEELDLVEERENAPPVRAPSRGETIEPAPQAKTKFSKSIDRGFDPSALQAWPRGAPLHPSFDMTFSMSVSAAIHVPCVTVGPPL